MEATDKIPQLRFPDFKSNWQESHFKDFFDFKPTNSLSRDKLNYKNGTIKNLHYGDIHTKLDGFLDLEKINLPFINSEIDTSKFQNDQFLIDGDLVIADASENYADIGKTVEVKNINKNKVVAGLHTFLARKKKNGLANGFAGQLMKTNSIRIQIQKIAQGTKVLGLSSKRVGEIKLNFPRIEEQRKIASFLTSIDKRIHLLEDQKKQLELYKQGLMQKIFLREIRFKYNGIEFPEWEQKRLGEIGESFNGLIGKTKENFGKGKSYIQYTQVFRSSKIKVSECGLVEVHSNENQNRVQFGDIFFTISSETSKEIAMASVLLDNVNEMYLNSFCFGFRPYSPKVLDPSFSQFLIRSSDFRRKVVPLAQGSTRYNLSKIELMKVKINLPSLKEQQKIASFLSIIDSQIDQVEKQLDCKRDFKKGLLQQMFI